MSYKPAKAGVFDDPRVHMARLCAAIGCPMPCHEALVAWRLDAQAPACAGS